MGVDEMKGKLDWFQRVALFFLIAIIIILGAVGYMILTTEYITVEGTVTDVEAILKDDGSIDYFIVTFDNNRIYKMGVGDGLIHEKNIDFTVNSSLIIELERNGFSSGVWTIKSITKIPGD